jgi:hypothetical protein
LKTEELKGREFKYMLKYREWTGILLNDLLRIENEFFINLGG